MNHGATFKRFRHKICVCVKELLFCMPKIIFIKSHSAFIARNENFVVLKLAHKRKGKFFMIELISKDFPASSGE
jgi:hypothetical protein